MKTSKLFNWPMIQFYNKPLTWIEAIHQGVNILVEHNYATKELAQDILNQTFKLGAYYVFETGIALLHAPPSENSLKAGAAILVLPENIEFNNENKWARFLVVLASPNVTDHMDIIQEFGQIFTNSKLKEKILKVKTIEDLKAIVKEVY